MKLRLVRYFIASDFAVYIVGLYKHYSSLVPIDPQPVVIATIVWHNRVPRLIGDSPGYPGRRTWEITIIVTTEWWSNGVVSQSRNYKGRESWRWYVRAAWVEDGSIIGYTYTIKQIPVDVDNKGRRYLPRVKY